jgi:hypothetical protein
MADDGIIEPDQLARTVVETLREERFYVLPHPEVEEYVRRKGDDVDRWCSACAVCGDGLWIRADVATGVRVVVVLVRRETSDRSAAARGADIVMPASRCCRNRYGAQPRRGPRSGDAHRHDLTWGSTIPPIIPRCRARRRRSSMAASARVPYVIVFSGRRRAARCRTIEHCAAGLAPLAEHARLRQVTLLLETLNSKIDHPVRMRSQRMGTRRRRRRLAGAALLYDCYHIRSWRAT